MSRRSSLSSHERLSTEERKLQAVETVVALAAMDSPDRLTTARVAKKMGLSDAILFRHFPNKASVWAAVMEWIVASLQARFVKVESENKSALATLEGLFHRHIDFVWTHPGVPRLIFSELQKPDDTVAKQVIREFLKQHALRVRHHLEGGRDSGEFRDDLDALAASSLFVGCIQGLVMQALLSGDPTHLTKAAPGVFELFKRSITTQAS